MAFNGRLHPRSAASVRLRRLRLACGPASLPPQFLPLLDRFRETYLADDRETEPLLSQFGWREAREPSVRAARPVQSAGEVRL